MDNASNCNKLAELLPEYISSFLGVDGRLRCLAHIINLVAKASTKIFIKGFAKHIYLDIHFFLL